MTQSGYVERDCQEAIKSKMEASLVLNSGIEEMPHYGKDLRFHLYVVPLPRRPR